MTEQGVVHFGDSAIQYQIVRRPRRKKTVEITVDSPGVVTVAAPVETTSEHIEATVRKRAKWIMRHNGTTDHAPPRRRFGCPIDSRSSSNPLRCRVVPFDTPLRGYSG